MILKNSSPPNRSNLVKEIEYIKHFYKEIFKTNNKSIYDDSGLIRNYNKSIKSLQSKRLCKILSE